MKVATVSLNYYKQNSKEACTAAGRHVASKGVDFAGFTEVRSPEMDKGLEWGLGAPYTYVDGGESPQAFNHRRWKPVSHKVTKLTDGEDEITPNLYAVVGVYVNTKTPRKRIAVISTHLVPLTQDGHERPDYHHRWAMWRKHWLGLKEIVRDLTAQGITVFVVGDFNHIHAGKGIIKQIDPKAKWVIRKGLDWVFVIEGKTKVRRFGITINFGSGSDHRAYSRTVFLR